MTDWLETLANWLETGDHAVLIIVAELRGSGPREAGARMLVGERRAEGTIGGGELEWRAIAVAREILRAGTTGRVLSNALGPELGQCCGGTVTLAFEPFAPSDLAWVKRLIAAAGEPRGGGRTLSISASGTVNRAILADPDANFEAEVFGESVAITERILRDRQPLWLFGAGHVGRALVRALDPLPFEVTWIDSREGAFPDSTVGRARRMALAMPELAVEEAPSGSAYLVMTHSHPLDEEICAAILARPDIAYAGLIGSETKQARFRNRLAARGLSKEQTARLHGPVGLAGLERKDPASIAASVAADLLIRMQCGFQTPDQTITARDSNVRKNRNA